MSNVPENRITVVNEAPVNGAGEYVLHWMVAFRRREWNFSLQRAVEWARELKKPLLILEALRCDYPWASDRLHQFVLDGMADNRRRFAGASVFYYPFVEREKGQGRGLLEALAARAAVVVTDDMPAFFLPRMVATAGGRLPVKMEKVDSNGLLPLRLAGRVFHTAVSFRRFFQENLRGQLGAFPVPDSLAGADLSPPPVLPSDIARRWPATAPDFLEGGPPALSSLPIDHTVGVVSRRGGSSAAVEGLRAFLSRHLSTYHLTRNHPDADATSGLSPTLHFGHIGAHQIFHELSESEEWTPDRLPPRAQGKREGWWGMNEGAEAFLEELLTWREVGFNMCFHRPEDCDRLESLPQWALNELRLHAGDRRPYLYTPEALESARTHDPLWNAAQRQLLQEGRLHNTLRMLWGKKILEWTESPEEALAVMTDLNNKYALDGRDPNSVSGIFWVLGRYDRPWGPVRPVFGKIRYMSSESTRRKVEVEEYLARYGEE